MVYSGKEGAMGTLRRTLLVVLVLGLALAVPLAGGAAAKGRPVVLYDVTMTLVGPEGLATTCGTLVMKLQNGTYIADGSGGTSVPILLIEGGMDGWPWARSYPEPGSSGSGFSGCHGGPADGSPQPWNGLLTISADAAGQTASILWHFDYYNDGETVVAPNGRVRYSETVREHFTVSSGGPNLSYVNGTVSGLMHAAYFLRNDETYVGYAPLGPDRTFAFTLTIAKHQS